MAAVASAREELRILRGSAREWLRSRPPEVRGEREVVLAVVQRDGLALEHASAALQADREVVLAAVQKGAFALRFASQKLLSDRNFVLAAVELNGYALACAPEALAADREVVLAAVREDGSALEYAAEELKADKEVALVAVRHGSPALEHVADSLWSDPSFAAAAAAENAEALEYVVDELQSDQSFVLALVKRNPSALEHAPAALLSDRAFLMAAVQASACALDHLPAKIRADRAFLLAAAKHQPEVLGRMEGHELWQDPDFVLAAVEHVESAFSFAAESLRSDRDIILRAVSLRPVALRSAAGGLQDDQSFALEAVALRGEALAFVSTNLRRDKNFVIQAVQKNPASIEYVPLELWSDVIFVLEALKIAPSALARAAPKLRSDRGLVLRAVAIRGSALGDAAPELQADRSVVESAILHSGLSEVSPALSGAAPELRNDRQIVLMALRRCGAALGHASDALRADAEVALVAVASDHEALRFTSPALRANPAFVLRAVGSASAAQPGAVLAHAAEVLRSNKNFVLECVELQPASIQYASPHLLRDRNFLLMVTCRNPETLSFLPLEFRTSRGFVITAVQADQTAFRFLPAAFQADPIVAEAMGIEPASGFGLVSPASPSSSSASSAHGDGEDFEFCDLFAENGDSSPEAHTGAAERSNLNSLSTSASASGGGMFDFDELEELEESRRGAGVSLQGMAELLGGLESMESADLMTTYKKLGLPLEPDMESQRLRSRLGSFRRWVNLPEPALADEWAACRRGSGDIRGSRQRHQEEEEMQQQVGGATGSRDEALSDEDQRKLLVRRLVTHACAEAWRSLGISAERFASMHEAARTIRRCARLSAKSRVRLAAKGRAWGLFVGGTSGRSDLELELKAIQIWRGLPVDELRKECEARGLSTCHIQGSSCTCRRQLIGRLVEALMSEALVKRRGIPVHRLSSMEAAWRVACEWERLEGLCPDAVRGECAALGLPAAACVEWYERKDLVHRLQRAALLRELPPGEVEADLISLGLRGSSPAQGANNGMAGSCGRGQVGARQSALDLALADVFSGVFFERRGVPVRELGSIKAASAVLTCWEHLASLTAEELAEEFHAKLGIAPLEAAAASAPQRGARPPSGDRGTAGEERRAELEGRLRNVDLWRELPRSGLREACRRFGLLAKWVDSGGGNGHNGTAAAEGPEELRERLLRTVCMEEYAARGIDLRRIGSIAVASKLLQEWERLERMQKDQLDLEYKSLGAGGVGSSAGGGSQPSVGRWRNGIFHAGAPERAPATPLETRRRLKAVAFWRALPYEELQRECWDLGCRSLYFESFRELEGDKATFLSELIAAGALQRVPASWPSGVKGPTTTPGAGTGATSTSASAPSSASGKQADPPRSPSPSRSPSPTPRPVSTERPRAVVKRLEALQLPPDANVDEVKKAFRKLALKYHPDKQEREASTQKSATEQFRSIAEAYNALLDYFKSAT